MEEHELLKLYCQLETAAVVSPHGLRKRMESGDKNFSLVDLRSRQEYVQAHIISAINIPVYADPDTAVYHEEDRILGEFRNLGTDKPIIVYCFSKACMSGKKIGLLLAEHGIYVKHLGVGWNEWKYQWRTWNHEHEWDSTDPSDYITSGDNPGEYAGIKTTKDSGPSCAC